MKDKLKWDYSPEIMPSPEAIYNSLAFDPNCEITPRAKELIISKCLNAYYWINLRGEDFVELSKEAKVIDGAIVKSTITELKTQTWELYNSLLGDNPEANAKSMILCIFIPEDGSISPTESLTQSVDPNLCENLIFGGATTPDLTSEVEVVMFIAFASDD